MTRSFHESKFVDSREISVERRTRPSDSPKKQESNATPIWKRESRRSSTHAQGGSFPHDSRSGTQTPLQSASMTNSPAPKSEVETVGGDVEVVQIPGEAPKLSRTMARKVTCRPPQLFLDYSDATSEAQRSYEVLKHCTYVNKYIGTTEHAMECDCNEEWDTTAGTNHACGEDSDCINRATKMECPGDCCCGSKCQNQRFQRRQYAPVSVIKTEKKGYGLRADADLPENTFIFEYIGEVIGDTTFQRRRVDYDKEGIKHFYFMSLNKGEFVDATKRGNMGRFCNHSCNPNCYVDKWVIGDKLRMGIFTERRVKAGEELVFNYNVDRYGADPQPCYCGEPNCTGFIGGKTQTERAVKLSNATIEALGIDDGDGWDLAVAKKSRKKKVGENDEEYVDGVQSRSLDQDGVVKVMATLMQCKEKWIAVKLLSRIQECDDESVRNRVVKMHGYQILKSQLSTWMDDPNIILQILYILHRLPRLTRNKIQDSGIEPVVEKLLENENPDVQEQAASIMKIWSALEVGYRIPRVKRDPAAAAPPTDREKPPRRSRSRSKSRSRSRSPNLPKGPSIPTGPRAGGGPQFRPGFFAARAPAFRPRNFQPPPNALPPGWFTANSNGRMYYYSASGQVSWARPSEPAMEPPPPPPKVATKEQALNDIIASAIVVPKEKPKVATPTTSTRSESRHSSQVERKKPDEKWRSYPIEKQMKLYENTIHPQIKRVQDKYWSKLPKDDLKRFAKEMSKKMVEGDYKNKRVTDPTQCDRKQQQRIRQHCKDYFDRACVKHKERLKIKAAKRDVVEAPSGIKSVESTTADEEASHAPADDEVILSDMEENDEDDSPSTGYDRADSELKRKREADDTPLTATSEDDAGTPLKRSRPDDNAFPPAPPPPPPPPADNHVKETPQPAGPSTSNGPSLTHRDSQRYDDGVGLGMTRSHVTNKMEEMHVDNDVDDDDYLVGHWGMDDSTDQRLPMRAQGS